MPRLTEPRRVSDPTKLPGPPLGVPICIQPIDNHWRTTEVPDIDRDGNPTVVEEHALTVSADAAILVNRGPGREAQIHFSEFSETDQEVLRKAFQIMESAAK